MSVAFAIASLLVTVIGLWAANNYRRQLRNRVSERLFERYSILWSLTGSNNQRWQTLAALPQLTPSDRTALTTILVRYHRALNKWYFDEAGGLLIPRNTRQLFFDIRTDVGLFASAPAEIRPPRLRDALIGRGLSPGAIPDDALRQLACAVERYSSLLRTQMTADVAVTRKIIQGKNLRPDEKELLKSHKIVHWWSPYAASLLRNPRRRLATCHCGLCD